MNIKVNYYLMFAVITILGLVQSCSREPVYTGEDIDISFSVDTLRFDTVFTSVGSATRIVKVYNKTDKLIKADIGLDATSFFRINVDGTPGPAVSQVAIRGNDSIYVFVEVNIDPNQPLSISPFIIEDAIDVSVNGIKKTLYLEAFGQNANYIPGQNVGGLSYKVPCNDGKYVMDDDKPFVIYGVMVIDSCTLIVEAGTKIFIHGGVVRDDQTVYNDGMILVLKDGNVRFEGTLADPITIQGDRLEQNYADIPGQYAGVVLWQESKNNVFKYTSIKNAIVGIRMDSLAEMEMYNCRITNTSGSGISGRHAQATIQNTLLYDNYGGGLVVTYGGKYHLQYCTMASYIGQNPSLYLNDYHCPELPCDERIQKAKLDIKCSNCIFSGSQTDEIVMSQSNDNNADFGYHFDHCLFRVDELLKPNYFPDFLDHCLAPINYQDTRQPLFLDYNKQDYTLDTMSVAREKGIPIQGIGTDINGNLRKSVPDIGCFELNL